MRPLFGFRALLVLSCAVVTGMPVALSVAQPLPSPDVAAVERDEEAFRSQQMDVIRKAIDAGDVFAVNGDFAKAEERYLYVIKNVDRNAPIGQSAYNRAVISIAQVFLMEGQAAEKKGDFAAAAALYKKAQAADPSTARTVKRNLMRLDESQQKDTTQRRDPEGTEKNPVITPEFKQQVADVQRLLFEGDRFFETGQYAEAEVRYRKALVIDAYNKAAQQKLERLDKYRYHAAATALDATRKEAMYQVDSRWTEREVAEGKAASAEPIAATESNVARIQKKLSEIMIDNISFNNTPVEDAFKLLAEKVRAADPDKTGLNFVLKLQPTMATKAAPAPAPAAATTAGKKPTTPAAPPAPVGPAPVTFSLSNSSLAEVLRLLTQLSHLKYKVDEYAITILPENESSDVLSTRTFVVPTGFFQSRTAGGTTSALGGDSTVSKVSFDVKQQLIDQGVDFPAGATATFLAESSRLIVADTADQIDLIDALIQAQSKEETPMVEIESKFAEFTDDSMRELSFNWQLGNGGTYSGSFANTDPNMGTTGNTTLVTGQGATGAPYFSGAGESMIGQTALRGHSDLSGNTLDTLLSAYSGNASGQSNSAGGFMLGGVIAGHGVAVLANLIDQMKGVDLLLAPKVTTKNGSKARIEVTREMTYPTRVEKPTYSSTGLAWDSSEGTSLVVVVTPPALSEFKTPKADLGADVGVQMEITPTAYPNRLIDLDITKLAVVDFEGFVNYGSTINQGSESTSSILTLATYVIPKPVFNTRSMTTKLQVLDGETIAMGGLIREETEKIDDKVPVFGDIPIVGRLFRSQVDKKTKKNLIIFVTARIVRSTGKAKYADTVVSNPVPPPTGAPAATPVAAMATP